MSGIKSIEPLELLLLATCWWHLSLIQGSLALAYSSTTMPSDLWDDGRTKNNMILDTSETALLTAILRETVNFFNLFAKDAKQNEDDGGSRPSWEIFEAKSLNVNAMIRNNGMFGGASISSYI